ncbi:TerD family protein [Kitasatospora kazusensis]
MIKGRNVALSDLSGDPGPVIVSLAWSSVSGEEDADVSVILLGADGNVRSDADLIFYNNRQTPDGSVQLLEKAPTDSGSGEQIGLDVGAVPEGVERIVVVASRCGRAPFGDLDEVRLTIADASGQALLGFSIEGATTETALLLGELYRREGAWRFRAIGQGYDNGLAGLATDFGIAVDDDENAEDSREVRTANAPATPVAAHAATESPTAEERELASSVQTPPRRPRTAKKKVTLPKTAPGHSLAENESWHPARLFPAPALKSDREREMRATSVLLAVMAQVPELGRRLTAPFGAPAGRMRNFTEVNFPHGDTLRRPDGIIRIERAGKLWTALLETKTNGNRLKPDQVQDYMDIAGRRGYEAVITLSNDVALEGRPVVDAKTDRRRKNKVVLWHLSWAEVAYQVQMLIRHEGVSHATHAWLLQELLQYMQHDNSGCHGFQNMGPSWAPVRRAIDEDTLCRGDVRATEVVESWERLIRQVCLRLGGELGVKILPVQRARRGMNAETRRLGLADQLCTEGQLTALLRIDSVPGPVAITADLRTNMTRADVDVSAPEHGYPLTWAKRLMRQLAQAPPDLRVETLLDKKDNGPRGTLERLRLEPADLLADTGDAVITGFRLSLVKGMGSSRGSTESGFIRSVDDLVDRFYDTVLSVLGAG